MVVGLRDSDCKKTFYEKIMNEVEIALRGADYYICGDALEYKGKFLSSAIKVVGCWERQPNQWDNEEATPRWVVDFSVCNAMGQDKFHTVLLSSFVGYGISIQEILLDDGAILPYTKKGWERLLEYLRFSIQCIMRLILEHEKKVNTALYNSHNK